MALLHYFKGFKEQMLDVNGVKIHTVVGGKGKEAILLLHGHPETYLIWRYIAPQLIDKYTVVLTDLRGYGDSSKPKGLPDHSNYSKREMAKDQVMIMQELGFNTFHLVGHDRGARVAHRLILDYPERVKTCTMMDILPTYDMYQDTNEEFATKYWHWFFYIQPYDFPERMLSSDPEFFINFNLIRKAGPKVKSNFPAEVMQEYIRCYANPATIHAICEDYRASASIDLKYDIPDRERMIETPLLVMWGEKGVVGKLWNVLEGWQQYASNVEGLGVKDCGHFVPEEQPEVVLHKLMQFLAKYES